MHENVDNFFLSFFFFLFLKTHKGVNQRSKYVAQVQQQRPTVTLTWHACKYKYINSSIFKNKNKKQNNNNNNNKKTQKHTHKQTNNKKQQH